MNLDDAKAMLVADAEFGAVYQSFAPGAASEELLELKRFFCFDLPPRKAPRDGQAPGNVFNGKPVKVLSAAPTKPTPVATGWMCQKAGCGGMLVRTGTCLTCQSCGESSGGCS